MPTVMLVISQTDSVRAEPFAGVGGATNVKLVVGDVPDFVDDRLFHDLSDLRSEIVSVTRHTPCVNRQKKRPAEAGLGGCVYLDQDAPGEP